MFNLWLLTTLFVISIGLATNALHADSRFPSCSQISVDADGDGYGYENQSTCIVDSSTSLTPVAGDCIDDNADGWGWNGIESCQVPVTANSECEDTDPIGDGWGWNGISSCRVVPAAPEKYSELDHLKSLLVSVTNRNENLVGMYCPDSDETFYLLISGVAEHYVGSQLQARGLWTTGLFEEDGIMSMILNGRYYSFGTDRNTRRLIVSSRRCVFLGDN